MPNFYNLLTLTNRRNTLWWWLFTEARSALHPIRCFYLCDSTYFCKDIACWLLTSEDRLAMVVTRWILF